MPSKGSPCSKDRPAIYPKFLFPLSPTYNVSAKLTAADIYGKLEQHEGFGGQNVWFWDNHPIRWVRVVGVVVAFDDYEKRVLITVDDGSGQLLELISWKNALPNYRQAPVDLTGVEPGSVIKAKGTIEKYRDMRQMKLMAATVMKDTNDEVVAWKSMVEFKKNILLKPWIVPQDIIQREEQRSQMGLQEGNTNREGKRKREEDGHMREQGVLREAAKEETAQAQKPQQNRPAKEEMAQAQEPQNRPVKRLNVFGFPIEIDEIMAQEQRERETASSSKGTEKSEYTVSGDSSSRNASRGPEALKRVTISLPVDDAKSPTKPFSISPPQSQIPPASEPQKRWIGRRSSINPEGIDRPAKRLNEFGFPIEITEEMVMRELRRREIAAKGIEKSVDTVSADSASGNASRGPETLKRVPTSLLVHDAKPPTKPFSIPPPQSQISPSQEPPRRWVGGRRTINAEGTDRPAKRLNEFGFPIEINEVMAREEREREISSSSSKGIEKSEDTVPGNSSSGNASRGPEPQKRVTISSLVDDAKSPTKPFSISPPQSQIPPASEPQERWIGRKRTINPEGIDRPAKRLNEFGFPIEITEEMVMRELRRREIASSSKGTEKSEYTVPRNSSSGNASRGLDTLKPVISSSLVDDAKSPTKPFSISPPQSQIPPASEPQERWIGRKRTINPEGIDRPAKRLNEFGFPIEITEEMVMRELRRREIASSSKGKEKSEYNVVGGSSLRANPPPPSQPLKAWKRDLRQPPNSSFQLRPTQSPLPSLQPSPFPENRPDPLKTPEQTYTFRGQRRTEPSPPPPREKFKVHYSSRTLKIQVQSYLSVYNHTNPTLELLRSNPSLTHFAQHVIEALPPSAIPLPKRVDGLLTSTLQTLVADGVLLPPKENSSEYELVGIANLKPFIVEAVHKAKRADGRIVAKEVWETVKRKGGRRWAEVGKGVVADVVADFLDSLGGWGKLGNHVWVWEGCGPES
ncbi:hypothetical protein RUND412_010231 [Rhizina undulata]